MNFTSALPNFRVIEIEMERSSLDKVSSGMLVFKVCCLPVFLDKEIPVRCLLPMCYIKKKHTHFIVFGKELKNVTTKQEKDKSRRKKRRTRLFLSISHPGWYSCNTRCTTWVNVLESFTFAQPTLIVVLGYILYPVLVLGIVDVAGLLHDSVFP